MTERAQTDPEFEGFERPPGPPGDWTRLANEALGGNLDALRAHIEDGGHECLDWCPICRIADVLRENATPELRDQWSSVQRELLMVVRSLVDHYLERAEQAGPRQGPHVEDIPIE